MVGYLFCFCSTSWTVAEIFVNSVLMVSLIVSEENSITESGAECGVSWKVFGF
jgi:hypothetical protein